MLNIYQKDGISVIPVIDKRREYINPDQKSGGCLYRIRIRVVYQRKFWEFSTGKLITESDWINKLEESKAPQMREIRKDLLSSFELIKKNVQELAETGNFSFDALNKRLKARSGETLNDLFKMKIETLESEGREGSRLYYQYVLNQIEKYKGGRIDVKAIKTTWLKNYENHLLTEGRGYTTIGMQMRAIRAILNDAKERGIIKASDYPFGGGRYEIPTGKGRKMALTLKQIKQIKEYTDGKEKTEFYRDLWLFSYLCNGINFIDLIQLKFSNIQDGEIVWLRQKVKFKKKSKEEIHAIITPEMDAIIKRWGNEPAPDKLIFPILKGGETLAEIKPKTRDLVSATNRRLKDIGQALEIGKISTYTARHSYATVLKRSGANIAYISESLGHADLKTTENYLASFERDERIKNAGLLTNFPADEPANETENEPANDKQ